jgi:hypothetical protein
MSPLRSIPDDSLFSGISLRFMVARVIMIGAITEAVPLTMRGIKKRAAAECWLAVD